MQIIWQLIQVHFETLSKADRNQKATNRTINWSTNKSPLNERKLVHPQIVGLVFLLELHDVQLEGPGGAGTQIRARGGALRGEGPRCQQ